MKKTREEVDEVPEETAAFVLGLLVLHQPAVERPAAWPMATHFSRRMWSGEKRAMERALFVRRLALRGD